MLLLLTLLLSQVHRASAATILDGTLWRKGKNIFQRNVEICFRLLPGVLTIFNSEGGALESILINPLFSMVSYKSRGCVVELSSQEKDAFVPKTWCFRLKTCAAATHWAAAVHRAMKE
jgi:hypothetical protein